MQQQRSGASTKLASTASVNPISSTSSSSTTTKPLSLGLSGVSPEMDVAPTLKKVPSGTVSLQVSSHFLEPRNPGYTQSNMRVQSRPSIHLNQSGTFSNSKQHSTSSSVGQFFLKSSATMPSIPTQVSSQSPMNNGKPYLQRSQLNYTQALIRERQLRSEEEICAAFNKIRDVRNRDQIHEALLAVSSVKDRQKLIELVIARREEVLKTKEMQAIHKLAPLFQKIKDTFMRQVRLDYEDDPNTLNSVLSQTELTLAGLEQQQQQQPPPLTSQTSKIQIGNVSCSDRSIPLESPNPEEKLQRMQSNPASKTPRLNDQFSDSSVTPNSQQQQQQYFFANNNNNNNNNNYNNANYNNNSSSATNASKQRQNNGSNGGIGNSLSQQNMHVFGALSKFSNADGQQEMTETEKKERSKKLLGFLLRDPYLGNNSRLAAYNGEETESKLKSEANDRSSTKGNSYLQYQNRVYKKPRMYNPSSTSSVLQFNMMSQTQTTKLSNSQANREHFPKKEPANFTQNPQKKFWVDPKNKYLHQKSAKPNQGKEYLPKLQDRNQTQNQEISKEYFQY